jgi:microcystin-dependent protein
MQPSLAINYIVPLQGIYPSHDGGGFVGSEPVMGFVYSYAGSAAPFSWASASGQLMSIQQNTALFSLLGNTYGGDGVQTFALPDLRGRAPIGVGQGAGLSNQTLGEVIGTESSTMTVAQMPDHDHTVANPAGLTGITGGNQPQSTMQPTLALHPIIAVSGIFPSRGGGTSGTPDEPLLGQIDLFAGNFAPSGWAFCDGQILSIAQNTALFSLLGTTYGGNGITTFALPDLDGRISVGFGQGAGLTNVDLGQEWGVENITLSDSQLPLHTHEYTPVPEPVSLSSMLIGAGGLMMSRRRRVKIG